MMLAANAPTTNGSESLATDTDTESARQGDGPNRQRYPNLAAAAHARCEQASPIDLQGRATKIGARLSAWKKHA